MDQSTDEGTERPDPSRRAGACAEQDVLDEVVRVLALPLGQKPFRTVVDFTRSHVDHVLEVAQAKRDDFVARLGFQDLLSVRR